MKIYYFGNQYIQEDNLAIKLCKQLKQEITNKNIEFIHINNTFQLVDKNMENAIIIDVVENLKKPKIMNIQDLKQDNIHTLHDFDLGFFLKLTVKNRNKSTKIIGIPQEGKIEEIKKEVKELLLESGIE